MPENIFNQRIAARYDEADRTMFDARVLTPTVDVLVDLANGGRVLEFAIGTGRVALPLSEKGVSVSGIELSQPMVDQLKLKPGGENIETIVGDMTTSRINGDFQLVYLVYNTITNLITQKEQVDCFCNAAAHLSIGGSFVIEDQLPTFHRLPSGEKYRVFDSTDEHVGIDEYNIAKQTVISHHYWMSDGCVETFHSTHRYAWPSEYDLMAYIAGLSLKHRWANWNRDPFTSESSAHISVWQKTK